MLIKSYVFLYINKYYLVKISIWLKVKLIINVDKITNISYSITHRKFIKLVGNYIPNGKYKYIIK